MADLFAPCCSIAPTRRRRFLWAAWWSGPPAREPFRKPDAYSGGARSADEARAAAERAAGMRLVLLESRWARAWSRVLLGQAPWLERAARGAGAEHSAPRPAPAVDSSDDEAGAGAPAGAGSIWAILGVTPQATLVEVKRAYRKRALATHPDRGGDPRAFGAVTRAYEEALRRLARKRARPR